MTDQEACHLVATNLRRLLGEQARTSYWLMKKLSVSPGALYPIIRGESLPSIGTSARIAEALGVSLDELIRRPENYGKKQDSRKKQKTA